MLLKAKGINPFLDKWNLVPGEPIEDALIQALEHSDSAVIFVGPGGDGPWQSEEMRNILKRAVKSHNEFRAIPVLLPGASAEALENSFLGSRLWIEFKSLDDDDALLRMAKAIKGEAFGDESFKLPDEPAPYRGLERFERIENPEQDFFFGRDDEIRALVERLVNERFVAVVGASGSGKSSLIRAGLTKQLAEDIHPGIRRWQTLTVEPGSAPFRSLAVQVAVAAGIPVADRESWIEKTVQKWSVAPDGLRTSIAALFADAPEPLLLFIDQFEELFTHRQEGAESERVARNFVANLADIWNNGGDRVRVVLALRADFVQRCLEIGPLKELLQDRTMLVGEVGDDALREIVKEPAARVGAFLEKGLMERILSEVRSQRGSLPLLQQALHELWRHRKGAWLTHDAFDASGGVARALNDQAQGAYKSLDDEQKKIADGLFPRLITIGEGVSDTRRRVKRSELYPEGVQPAAVNEVIDKLSGKNARILVTTREGGTEENIGSGEDFVEFTHEALLGNWQHLVTLLDSERESIRKHRRLTSAAEEWKSKPEDEQHKFLLRAGQLLIVEQWAADEGGYARLNQLERRFLEESIQERTAEQARKRRTQRNLRFAGLAVVLLTLIFSGVVWWQWQGALEKLGANLVANLFLSVDEEPAEFDGIVQQLKKYRKQTLPKLKTLSLQEEGKERADAAIALFRLDAPDDAVDLLHVRTKYPEAGLDPEHLTQFVHRCKGRGVTFEQLRDQLYAAMLRRKAARESGQRDEQDDAAEQTLCYGLLLALGEFNSKDTTDTRDAELLTKLEDWYGNDPSSAIHSACGWLLRTWGHGKLVDTTDRRLAREAKRKWFDPTKEWFVLEIDTGEAGEAELFTFVVFQPGLFQMGTAEKDEGDSGPNSAEEKQHYEKIRNPFAICDREVTHRQWQRLMVTAKSGSDRDLSSAMPDHPATFVSFDRAEDYCRLLSARAEQSLRTSRAAPEFRLPLEKEWEYACRGGTITPYSFGSDEALFTKYGSLNVASPEAEVLHDVATLRPNIRGLFDVHGNVKEWCEDRYALYGERPQEPEQRVLRGGGGTPADRCRSAARESATPTTNGEHFGFRLCVDVP